MFKRRTTPAGALRGALSQGVVRLDPLRAMPLERSIAWGPALVGDARPSRPAAPGQIFIKPSAVHDVTAQIARDGAGSLGYFVGERFRDAESKEPWVLVDAVIPVAMQSTRTPIGLLLDATVEQARAQARGARRHVVGWYHSAECGQPVLTASDAEAHERHFAKTHSFMLMIAIGRQERQAALFRPSLERGPVPFYELLDPEAAFADGARPTAVNWPNYFTVDSVARASPTRTSGSTWAVVEAPPPEAGASPPAPAHDAPTQGGNAELVAPAPTRLEARTTVPRGLAATERQSAGREVHQPAPSSPLARRTPTARARSSGGVPAPLLAPDLEPAAPAAPDIAPVPPVPVAIPVQPAPIAPIKGPIHTSPTPPNELLALEAPRRDRPAAPPLHATAPGPVPPVARAAPRVDPWRTTQAAMPLPPFRIIDPAVFDKDEYRWWEVRAKLRPYLFGGLGMATLVAFIALGSGYTPALWPERQEPAPRRQTVERPLGWAAGTMANAVTRYRGAARFFDEGRLTCEELGAYLVSVDEAWITYSIERAAMREPLDAAALSREGALESDVAEIERHFRASGCSRP